MKYYSYKDERLAELLNLEKSFDVVRREVGKDVKIILYFLSSLADSERVNELNVSLMLAKTDEFLIDQISSGAINEEKDVYRAFLAISSGMSVILDNENISVVIPGMESIDQIIENNRIINEELTAQEKKEIDEVRKKYGTDAIGFASAIKNDIL